MRTKSLKMKYSIWMYIVFGILEGLFLHLVDNAVSSAKDVHGVVTYKKCPDYFQSFLGRLRGEVGLGRTIRSFSLSHLVDKVQNTDSVMFETKELVKLLDKKWTKNACDFGTVSALLSCLH